MKYHYSSYWKTWSRVLSEENGHYVEVNLTPIPCCTASTWERDVWPPKIREHCTPRAQTDIDTDELPEDVMTDIFIHVGGPQLDMLLNYNFLPEIDWNVYRKICNGGARWEDIRKVSQ